MKKCSQCGRDNIDDALHCGVCGTDFQHPDSGAFPKELKQIEPTPSGRSSAVPAGMRIIASLEAAGADKLIKRLEKEAIPVEVQTVTEESGMPIAPLWSRPSIMNELATWQKHGRRSIALKLKADPSCVVRVVVLMIWSTFPPIRLAT